MAEGCRPSKKITGRSGPPPGYPKDQNKYADPENWKYPVHTPHHAVAARRYFNKERNRDAYEPEEQFYIDSSINEALKKFGIEPKFISSTRDAIAARGLTEEKPPPDVQTASLEECLEFLLGKPRLKRAKAIKDNELTIHRNDDEQLVARVRDYSVTINFRNKIVAHDCADLNRRKTGKKLCKHFGKIMLTMEEDKAVLFLRNLIVNLDSWRFI